MAAEEARAAIGAASLSVSRWEREQGVLRTIINVGELGPAEERYPAAEIHPLREDPNAERLILDGNAYFNSVDAPDVGRGLHQAPRAPRQGVRGRGADPGRGRGLGRGLRDHRARPAALSRRGRALPRDRRRPAGRGDRPGRAVLARVPARLRGPAHRPGEPARARGAPPAGGLPRDGARGDAGRAALRRRRAQEDQRPGRPRRRRPRPAARGRGARRRGRRAPWQPRRPAVRRRVLRRHGGRRPRRGARARSGDARGPRRGERQGDPDLMRRRGARARRRLARRADAGRRRGALPRQAQRRRPDLHRRLARPPT